MSDNFNNIMDNIIRFIAGERPSADKFNALVAYFSQNSQELNNALGDIRGENNPFLRNRLTIPWGRQIQSDDSVDGAPLRGRYLDIANIGRLIGPSSNLNNRYLSSGSFKISDEKVISNSTEYKTKFPVEDIADVTITKNGAPLNYVDQGVVFSTTSQFKLKDGSFIFSSLTDDQTYIDYTTNPSQYGSGANYQGSRFNVIPDPNQDEQSNRIEITPIAGGYFLDLPNISAAQSNLNQETISNLNNEHVNFLKNDGLNSRQKYLLPKVLTDSLIPANNPEDAKIDNQIPKYFLYLKCENTEEVFLDADYYYMNESRIYVEDIDLGNCDLDNDTFRIVTVGTDITTSIDDLRVKFIKHSHDGTFGEEAINVKNLVGLFEDQTDNVYTKSVFTKNPFSSYLHRDGYKASELENINANNTMRGHLVLGNTNGTDSRPNSASGESFKLAFGLPSNPASIDVYEIDELLHAKTAHLMLASSENLRIASAAGKGIESYFADIYSVYGFVGNQASNRMQLKANDFFVEEDVKHLLSVGANGNLSEKKIASFTKTIDENNDKEITSIVEKTDYKVSSSKHTAILADVFELGTKYVLTSSDQLETPEVGDDLTAYKTRAEQGRLYETGKENIISGGFLNPSSSDFSPVKTFLNLNSDLYRKERKLFYIGYTGNAGKPLAAIPVFNDSDVEIWGHAIRNSNCDVVIGNWNNIENREGNNGTGANVNIYLDLKHEAGNRSNYLRNGYAGTEFNINIIIGEDYPNPNNLDRFLNIISLGDPFAFISDRRNINFSMLNGPGIEGAITKEISRLSFYQNDRWNVGGPSFFVSNYNATQHYNNRQYISLKLGAIIPSDGAQAQLGHNLQAGSVLNLKGVLFENPTLVGNMQVDNNNYVIDNKDAHSLTYAVEMHGALRYNI